MSRKKTFDPDDKIKSIEVSVRNTHDGFASGIIGIRVEAYKKPNEPIASKPRGFTFTARTSCSYPKDIACVLITFADELFAATRKTPRLNKRPTHVKARKLA